MLEQLASGSVVLGRFAIDKLAGQGGMGAVYRAVDQKTGSPVALKVLFNAEDEARFLREAQLLAELRHPGIVGYVHHGHTEKGQPFLAMEWLSGCDLAEKLRTDGLTLRETLLLTQKACEALSQAHQRGVIHRDLKPSNLFLVGGEAGKVVLLDFGIARRGFGGRSIAMTRTGAIVGTPEYMAPEQARGVGGITPAADVFSLGCVLHECLTGNPPFVAAHVAAVLAKILFEEAPKLRALRPELPAALEMLLDKMLGKDPLARFGDAKEVLAELSKLPAMPTLNAPLSEQGKILPSIRGGEQQLVSVLLVSEGMDASSDQTMAEAEDAQQTVLLRSLRTQLSPSGMVLERLADGSILGTLHGLGSGAATDLATRAARAALHIHERWGEASIAIATGKGVLAGDFPVGEAVDRAAMLLRERTTGGGKHTLLLDDLTAGLLDARFEVLRLRSGTFALVGEKLSVDESRKLLGKPTPCVGREQELAMLAALFEAGVEESTPRVALVVAAAGVGKTRLRQEFLRRIEKADSAVQVFLGRGDAMNPHAPFGLWAEFLRGSAGMGCRICQHGERDEAMLAWENLFPQVSLHVEARDAARVTAFLSELAGVSPPLEKYPALHAARSNSRLFFEQASQAVADFLRGLLAKQQVVLVLEDLQWADAQSLELLDAVLRLVPESPLFVLLLARPEYETRLPKLGKDRGLQEIHLGGLGKRASERLVKSVLGPTVAQTTVSRMVEQAAGNALYLEELIRAFSEGKTDQLPDTVLAMLQARIGRLSTEQRKVLRVASMFGEVFYRGGVLALLGGSESKEESDHLDQVLHELGSAEIVERQRDSRFANEVEYRIRHSLLREAAYSLLTDEDRKLGHKLCAEFLKRMGETDHAALARHYDAGGDAEQALFHYIEAAVDSWRRGGLQSTNNLCQAAIRLGAMGESLGAIRCIEAQIALFNGDISDGLLRAQEAAALSQRGSRFFYWSILAMLATAMLSGRLEVFLGILNSFDGTMPKQDAAWFFLEAASVVAQLQSYLGLRDSALHILRQMHAVQERFDSDPQRALFYAAWQRATAVREVFLENDPYAGVRAFDQAMETYRQFGQVRGAALIALDGTLTCWATGNIEGMKRFSQAALECAQELGDRQLLISADIMTGSGRLYELPPDQHDGERKRLEQVLREIKEDRVRRGQSFILLGNSHLRTGEWDKAETYLRAATEELAMLPTILGHVYSSLVVAFLKQGKVAEAEQAADAAVTICTTMLHEQGPFVAMTWMTKAEVLLAQSKEEEAKSAIRKSVDHFRKRLAKAPTELDRKNLIENVWQHKRIQELCERLLGESLSASEPQPL